jgi:hypothetical protein
MSSREGKSGEATHKEEDVGIFDGRKWAKNSHTNVGVRGNRLCAKYVQKLGAHARFRSVGAHFDDHGSSMPDYDGADEDLTGRIRLPQVFALLLSRWFVFNSSG